MPSGYYGTIVLALFANERYQALATAELKRKGLGPFRERPADDPSSVRPMAGQHPLAQGAILSA
jgi:hypothetical protein